MKKILIIIAVFFSCFVAKSQILLVNGWKQTVTAGYVRSISIDYTKIGSADLTDFTITVEGTFTYLKTVANGGNVTDAQGDDIYFSSDQAGTTKLSFKQLVWSATTGLTKYKVKIPTVAHATANTVIYMRYGDGTTTTFQGGSSGGHLDGNTKASWSLEDGTTLISTDATSNSYDLTQNSSPTAATGKSGGGAAMGSSGTLTISSSAIATTSYTYQMWAKSSATGYAYESGDGGSNENAYLWWQSGNNRWVFGFNTGSQWVDHFYSTSAPDDNAWHNYAVVMDDPNNLIKFYIDGVEKVNEAETTSPSTAGTQLLTFGQARYGAGHWNATFDEIKINSVVRTAGWIGAVYYDEANSLITISSPL